MVEEAVSASLNFYAAPENGEKPQYYMYTHSPQRNFGDDPHLVSITDIRGKEDRFTLDASGFQIVKYPTKFTAFDDDERIKTEYYKEIEELLKEVIGAQTVVVYDHTIRRRIPGQSDNPACRGPLERVHVDQTSWAGERRARIRGGMQPEELAKHRAQVINIWRSINGVVEESPLALADARTIHWENDLVPVTMVYPHELGETYSVKYSERLRFYYKSKMDSDEVYLFKCYESETDGRARLSPHTAFRDPTSGKDAKPRHSIEIRALAFSKKTL